MSDTYWVFCRVGHHVELAKDNPLALKCLARQNDGVAPVLEPEQCPACTHERERREANSPYAPSGHWVQCIGGGHVFELMNGDPRVQKCIQRAADGKLDALILGPDDCEMCREERASQARREVRMCGDAGCPMSKPCKKECLARKDLLNILFPPKDPDIILINSSRASPQERIAAARRAGWVVRHITKGRRGNKYRVLTELRNPKTDERVPLI